MSKPHHIGLTAEKVKKPLEVARPDVAQMTPFKPSVNWYPGEHRIPGGVFPMPPAASDLCTRLPPPTCFEGPFVVLDHLLRTMATANLNPVSVKEPKEAMEKPGGKETSASNNSHGNKRKHSRDRDFSDNEEEDYIPTNDLYRKRQQRRIK